LTVVEVAARAQEAKDAKTQAIQPAEVKLGRPVDFERDVYPILDAKCFACHNVAINENGLNLEDVKSILKGGKRGPSVIAKDPDKSLLYKLASRSMTPAMPPLPNKVEATAVTPQELGIIRQWILEGANAGMGGTGNVINWQPLPKGIHPIYAVALTPDGQFAAAGRGNKVVIYHVPTGELVAELTDPALLAIQHNGKPMYEPGSSHRDFVHSLAFNSTGTMLASGSFREVKLWTRPESVARLNLAASTGAVPAVAVSPDSKWIATASADNTIKLFNLADGQPGKVLAGHAAAVSGLQFSPDSAKLFSSSLDKSVRVWNVADGAAAGRFDVPAAVNGIALSVDASKIILACADNLVRIFAVPSPATPFVAPAAPVPAIRVSPDKKLLALAEADGKITLIDLTTGKPVKQLAGHTAAVTSLAFSGNSARLVSGSADKTARVWDVAAGTQILALTGSPQAINAVALHANGLQAASGAADGQIVLWKLDAAEPKPLAGDNGAAATVSAVSPDGKQLATAGLADNKPVIFIRDIASGNITKTLPGHEGPITSLSFSADNTKLISGSADKTARVWNLADNKELAKFVGHANTVTGVALNSNGTQAASGAADNTLKVWNVADAKEIANCAGHTGAISDVAFTPNNQSVISASADQTIRLWNPANGQQAGAIPYGQPVTAMALSFDGTKIAATGSDNNVRVYQLDGKLLLTLAGHAAAPKAVAFSNDNTRLVSSGPDNLAIAWDVATGAALENVPVAKGLSFARFGSTPAALLIGSADKAITLYSLHFERFLPGNAKGITGLAFSPQGDAVYSSSEDGTVRRYAAANAAQQWAQNHGAPIHDLALSPDGNLLATAGDNNQVRVWAAANGGNGPQPTLAGFAAPVKSVAFSLDNAHIASGTANNLVLVHDVKSGAVEQVFAEHAGAVEAIAAAGENGKLFITSGAEKSLRSFPLVFEKQIAGHTGPVTSVAIVPPQGAKFITGSDDGTVRVWDLAAGTQAASLAQGGPVTSVAVSSDGLRYASASANNSAKLWNAGNNQQIAEMKGDLRHQKIVAELTADDAEAKATVTVAMNAIPAAEKVVTERTEAQKKATDAKTAAEKVAAEMAEKAKTAQTAFETAKKAADDKKDDAALAKAAADAMKVATDAAAAAKKADDDKLTATKALEQADKALKEANDAVAKAKTTHADSTTKQKAVETALAAAKTAMTEKEKPIRAIRFSRDGKELAMAGDATTISTFDGLTGAAWGILDGHKGPVLALDYAAGSTLVSGSADQSAKAWNLNPGWALAGVLGPKKEAPQDLNDSVFISRILCLDFNADGTLLATGGGDPSRSGELILWNVPNRAIVRNLESAHSDTVFGVKFSPDGQQLLSGAADKFVKIHDVASGKLLKSFEGHTNHVLGVTWRHDGKFIASAGADNAIKVWNVETGEQARTIGGYAKQVTSIEYMGRGPNILSCGGDKTVRFHQGDNGNNFRNFAGATDFMFAAAASRDEKVVVAAGQDGILRVWNGTNAQVIKTFEPPKPPEANQQAQAK
jgi:WD40 repeat protein